jgi:hypothetical protein
VLRGGGAFFSYTVEQGSGGRRLLILKTPGQRH